MENRDLWFREGLRFECTQCGNCCTGEPGFVWVNQQEIVAMAALVGMDVAEFQQKCVRRAHGSRSLREKPNGECVLYEPGAGCTVYEARPRQCRSWPFWESNLESRQAWLRMCRGCPGAGSGPLYTVEQILEESARIRV